MKNPVSDLFGKSPIKPLQEHMLLAANCAARLDAFLAATLDNNWEEAENIYNDIRELEHQADHLKRDLRLNMPNSLFMPVPRTDLLDLISLQDKVANIARDIAGIMLGRRMLVPATIQPDFIAFLTSSVLVSDQALVAINELDELLESGFKGKEIDIVFEMINKLDNLEKSADDHERGIRHKLQANEKDLPPIDAMFLYKVIDNIGELANTSQRVGSRLLLLLAR
ncbi:MAG: TIGR00153 family protein [Porticoccaceae bacterium]